jgi:hypothetical protein
MAEKRTSRPARRQEDILQADATRDWYQKGGRAMPSLPARNRDLRTTASMEKPQPPRHLAASRIREPSVADQPKCPPVWVIGPLGESLTMQSLPAPKTARWVPRRKA